MVMVFFLLCLCGNFPRRFARPGNSVADGGRATDISRVVDLLGGECGDVGAGDGPTELVCVPEAGTDATLLRSVGRPDEAHDGPVQARSHECAAHASDLLKRARPE